MKRAPEETADAEAKRPCISVGTPMTAHVQLLDGEEFDVDIAEGERVSDLKVKIQEKQGYCRRPHEMQLILGSEALGDAVVLADTSVKDGDSLTLLRHLGIMELHVASIDDDTQWHGRHKFALRSESLPDEVEKIEVSVRDFRDQGWGGCQARLFIYLHDPAKDGIDGAAVASKKIFGPLRTAEYDERLHGRSPSCTLGPEEPVVALARPGMLYKLRYQCGGGGGHSITVKDWRCRIFPRGCSLEEVTTKVDGTVQLNNTSRLGPDKKTGKWELAEPPYP